MKPTCRLLAFCCLAAALSAHATTHYVSPSGGHNPPFSSWDDAATNIQAAVDVATNSSLVLVTNGTYALKGEILVTNGITVASVNGQDVTTVTGCSTAGCFKLMHSNAVLRGFTIRGGNALYGAGVYIYNGGRVESCAIKHNRTGAIYYGGLGAGIHVALDGVISGCEVISNLADYGSGGGIYAANAVTVSNCVIRCNQADYGGGGHAYGGLGGGLYLVNGGTVRGCVIEQNGGGAGGGVYCIGSAIEQCRIVSNATWFSYDFQSAHGGGIAESSSRVENCLIAYNTAGSDGGGVSGSPSGIVQNCTIVNNHAQNGGGGSAGGGTQGSNLRNCIAWGNTCDTGPCNYTNGTITYTCTTPLPGSGEGNITNAPLFADAAFRLAADSPGIDAGSTNDAPFVDLDGTARPLDGNGDGTNAFDMGAYEFAATNVDTDADGQSDYDEAVAGTDGTTPNSTFSAQGVCPNAGGYVIEWDTVLGRDYTLRTRTSLFADWADVPGQTNLPGTGAAMCYTNPAPADTEFYAVKVHRP
ncbi:MAG: hypothetical protein JXB04_02400 [Kiritimatiellae bacterium]|nr:hypothetical protein [Kiritimatiellia bacterium]